MSLLNDNIDLDYLWHDSRAQVYLLWAFIIPAGFILTHFHQAPNINIAWSLISVAGLGYMFRVMPLRVRQMQRIYGAWLLPITVGMIVSIAAFRITALAPLISYLGAFWLLVMAVGYGLNGIVDAPSGWYWFAVFLNVVAGLLCFFVAPFTVAQYLIAAIITAWSMLNLWVLRT